ncbi:DUF3450 family protein [Engelhardtia mirabilis]|uniref:Chromosome partition protein Smc n=1 Tax=Engelhardtia mirabilis TaxID=2528011 RepID=A0A518BGG7_9BACT|nr:hypothetical protein Pla133_11540 [Planctomycetes bacterium Pla133]QDV00415.1 hypothetical protein Pla86_11540 [Planctomycetes bacterium Pla86]
MNNTTQQRPGFRRITIASAVVTGLAAAALVGAAVPVQDGSQLESTRTALESWVQTRRLISSEREQWRLGRELLTSEVELMRDSIASLDEDIAAGRAQISETDTKREELVATHERLKESSAGLAAGVEALEGRVRELLVRLPDPVLERVRPLIQQLPEAGAETKLGLAERYRNVVGILDQVGKFNREISVTSEVRELSSGNSAEVSAMYLGLGQAYFVTGDGKSAGVGRPTAQGWVWTPRDDAAPEIAAAIEVYKQERPASFVRLPIQVD